MKEIVVETYENFIEGKEIERKLEAGAYCTLYMLRDENKAYSLLLGYIDDETFNWLVPLMEGREIVLTDTNFRADYWFQSESITYLMLESNIKRAEEYKKYRKNNPIVGLAFTDEDGFRKR